MQVIPRRAFLFLLLVPLILSAQGRPDPATLPAHEEHEGLLVAADPHHDAARSKDRFGKKHPQASGILAVEVFLRNNNDTPIRIELERIRLLIEAPDRRRQRLEPLTLDDVLSLILNKDGGAPKTPRKRLPLPLPQKSRAKEWEKQEAILRPMSLEMGLVPPRSTVRGFLFFDVAARFEWVRHARLYIPDVYFFGGKPLLFFEVDLAPASDLP